jgi:protein dithiol:quinone oxidoreductase
MPRSRLIFILIALICATLLGYGYYLEHFVGQEPCPLCIFQRMAFFAVFIISAVAAIHGSGLIGTRIYAGLIVIASGIGGAIASRQVWLQGLPPDQVPECGPGLEYMLEVFPLMDALRMILSGSGECAEVHWTFLGLSIAGWSLIWFFLITLTAIYLFWKPVRNK